MCIIIFIILIFFLIVFELFILLLFWHVILKTILMLVATICSFIIISDIRVMTDSKVIKTHFSPWFFLLFKFLSLFLFISSVSNKGRGNRLYEWIITHFILKIISIGFKIIFILIFLFIFYFFKARLKLFQYFLFCLAIYCY